MKLTDKAGYEDWKAKNANNPYGMGIFNYAEAWADLMEKEIATGKPLETIAKDTSHKANAEGITGFMYGATVSILAKYWEHGEALRRWHNLDTQIGTEGERANANGATLNPALLCVN